MVSMEQHPLESWLALHASALQQTAAQRQLWQRALEILPASKLSEAAAPSLATTSNSGQGPATGLAGYPALGVPSTGAPSGYRRGATSDVAPGPLALASVDDQQGGEEDEASSLGSLSGDEDEDAEPVGGRGVEMSAPQSTWEQVGP